MERRPSQKSRSKGNSADRDISRRPPRGSQPDGSPNRRPQEESPTSRNPNRRPAKGSPTDRSSNRRPLKDSQADRSSNRRPLKDNQADRVPNRRPIDRQSQNRSTPDRELQNRSTPDREYEERRRSRARERERQRAARKKRLMLIIGGVALLLVIVIIIGVISLGGNGDNQRNGDLADTNIENNQDSAGGTSGEVPAEFREALDSGRNTLDIFPLSRSTLRGQLEGEGFSRNAVEYALGELDTTVDWYDQALRLARIYLESPEEFSEAGLADQLIIDGFTQSEADHGAGLAFNE